MRLAGRISIFVVLYGCTAFAQGQWRSLGDVTSVEKLANGVELSAGAARVRITVLAPTVVRLRYSPQGSFGPDQSFAVLPDAFAIIHRNQIVELGARHRLPAVYPYRFFASIGGLLCYGIVAEDLFRRGAAYVGRILKGAKPADLPVQAPTNFELVVNLKTAAALGLTIPQTILARADEVIE